MIIIVDKYDKIMIHLLAMITFSYNLSPETKKNLEKIEELKRKILFTPLSPKKELRLRWETQLNRVFWSLTLSEDFGSKKQFIKTFCVISSASRGKSKNVLEYGTVHIRVYDVELFYKIIGWIDGLKKQSGCSSVG